ncbi:hypothetical protein ACLB1O_08325 [Escherichia coli]
MARERSDYTRAFAHAALLDRAAQRRQSPLRDEFIDRAAFDDWFARSGGVCNKTRFSDVSVSN